MTDSTIITVYDLTPEEAETVILRKHDYPKPSSSEPAHVHLLRIRSLGWTVATMSDQREIMHYINYLKCTPMLLEEALCTYVCLNPAFAEVPYSIDELKRQISLTSVIGYKKANLQLINRNVLREGIERQDATPAELQKALDIAQKMKVLYAEINSEILRNRELLEGTHPL